MPQVTPHSLSRTSARWSLSAIATIAALAALLMYGEVDRAQAAVVVTPASGGTTISADTAATGGTGAYADLGSVVIAEGLNGDLATQAGVTLILTAPTGFEFNSARATDVAFTAARDITAASLTFPTATTLQVTFTTGGVLALDTITIGGVTSIQIRPTAGTPLATGNIQRRAANPGTAAAIPGITNDVTDFGTLTEVVGAANKLAVTTQPSASTVAGVAFAQQPIVTVQDQFGNTRTGDNATVVTAALTTGSGTLSGTLTKTAAAGVASFAANALSINLVGSNKVLTFTAGGLTSASTAPAFAITVAAANAAQSVISAVPTSLIEGGTSAVTVQAKDAFGNLRTSTSGAVVLNTSVGALGAVTDAGNGTYTATLSATAPGTATISGTLGGAAIGTNASVTINALPAADEPGAPPPAAPAPPSTAPPSATAPSGVTGEPGIVASGSVPAPASIGLLVTSGPTTTAQLVSALALKGCTMTSAAVLQSGAWRVYIAGAPAAVNAAFPAQLGAATAFFVRC